MARVLIFSRNFPKGHPRFGELTNFVEKYRDGTKKHTVRAGNSRKVGDSFSPRYWTGKPYNSPQAEIAEVNIIKRIYEFKRDNNSLFWIKIDGEWLEPFLVGLEAIGLNDGLSLRDFTDWFNKPFEGQILIWDDELKY